MRHRPRLGGYGAPTLGVGAGLPLVAVADAAPIGDSGPVPRLILHPGPQSETPPESGRPRHPVAHSSSGRSADAAWVGANEVTVAQPFRSRSLSEPSGTGRSLATRSRRRPTSSCPVITVRTPPTGAKSAHRRPLVSDVGLSGTLRLSTVRGGASTIQDTMVWARSAADCQWGSRYGPRSPFPDGATSRLTAKPDQPKRSPARTAPMVPENRVERPVLGPRLMPATTALGGSPNPPKLASMVISAGGAATENPINDSPSGKPTLTSSTATRSGSSMGPSQADAPLQSVDGATTTG